MASVQIRLVPTADDTNREFLKLCREFPPLPIRSDGHAAHALMLLNTLENGPQTFTRVRREYAELLRILVNSYRETRIRQFKEHPTADSVVLSFLLDTGGSDRNNVSQGAKITVERLQALLLGDDTLTCEEIVQLCDYFDVDPDIFDWSETIGTPDRPRYFATDPQPRNTPHTRTRASKQLRRDSKTGFGKSQHPREQPIPGYSAALQWTTECLLQEVFAKGLHRA